MRLTGSALARMALILVSFAPRRPLIWSVLPKIWCERHRVSEKTAYERCGGIVLKHGTYERRVSRDNRCPDVLAHEWAFVGLTCTSYIGQFMYAFNKRLYGNLS